MIAEIITIGDEILIGQIIDTNSAWMAQQLNAAGIEIYQITSVHDKKEHIINALSAAEKKVDLVLLTGGLGPTRDDITKNTLCAYFNTHLEFHPPTFDQIKERFLRRGFPVNKLDHDQALVPANSTVIPNHKGTAPGIWFEKESTLFISMPGVPYEMEEMMTREIIPRLIATGRTKTILHKTILTQGVGESMLAERLEKWENELPFHISLAYLPNPMGLKLRLSASGDASRNLQPEIDQQVQKLLPLIADCFFGYDKDTLATVVGRLLLSKNATLSVAESCTGGNISHLITQTPGCSKWYQGSITAYNNSVKINCLGVSETTLEQSGAVSRETAAEMALGAKKYLQSDYSIATTGIAGPDGGSNEKPVGTVWIAIATPAKLICEKYVFGNDRERTIMRSSQTSLQLLRKLLSEELTII
jgi:nicotinamide-nucleotide amidase